MLAVFGAPVAQEDHAQRAVLAALDLQRRVREASMEGRALPSDALELRVGLHTGPVAVGMIGEPGVGKSRLCYEFPCGSLAHPWVILETQATCLRSGHPLSAGHRIAQGLLPHR